LINALIILISFGTSDVSLVITANYIVIDFDQPKSFMGRQVFDLRKMKRKYYDENDRLLMKKRIKYSKSGVRLKGKRKEYCGVVDEGFDEQLSVSFIKECYNSIIEIGEDSLDSKTKIYEVRSKLDILNNYLDPSFHPLLPFLYKPSVENPEFPFLISNGNERAKVVHVKSITEVKLLEKDFIKTYIKR